MAKRKRQIDIKKRIKEGYGVGRGYEYKPWLKIQDVPSLGRVSRIKGIKTGRKHELLSDMERNFFYILDFSDIVQDVREQFPLLPIEETILIANEMGIEHPKDPETGELIVITTDFLINVFNNDESIEIARTIKSKDDLLNKRVLEKFEIERVYWQKRGVDWGIVTDEEIDKTVARNISFVHSYKEIGSIDSFSDIEDIDLKDLIYEFLKRIIDNPKAMRKICSEFDDEMCLKGGSGLSVFKYLIINKIIEVDITKMLDVSNNIPIISVIEESIKKVEAI